MKHAITVNERILVSYPTGSYYVGDPRYVYPKEQWSRFCDTVFDKPLLNGIDCEYRINVTVKEKFFVCGTAYGDGNYPIRGNGHCVGFCRVDAGLLAVIPMTLISAWQGDSLFGVIMRIDAPFHISAQEGNFSFASYSVNTDGDEP